MGPCFEYTDVEILRGAFTYLYGFTTEKPITMGDGGRFAINDAALGIFDAPSTACDPPP